MTQNLGLEMAIEITLNNKRLLIYFALVVIFMAKVKETTAFPGEFIRPGFVGGELYIIQIESIFMSIFM